MPKSNFKKRYVRKRSSRRKVSRKAVKAIVKEVAMQRLDSKVHDENSSQSIQQGSPLMLELNKIVAGTGQNNRTGDSCFLKTLRVNIQIVPSSQCFVRLIVVTPKRGYLTLLAADIATNLRQDLNLISGKFNVLAERWFGCDDLTDLKTFIYQRKYGKGGRKIDFRSSGEAKVPLYLFMITDKTTAGTAPEVFYQSRLWFKDEDS